MNLEATLRPYLDQFNAELEKYLVKRKPEPLYEAIRHLPIEGGGKRLRPIVALLAAQAVGGDSKLIMPYGVALEVLHCFTLVHDDIMDECDTRRGVEAVHKKYGPNLGILAGDTMFAIVFEQLDQIEVDDGMFRSVVHDVARLAREVCEGQYWDMAFENQKKIEEMDYYHMIERKTATMFEMACKNGARIAGAEPSQVKKLAEAGRLMGLAFQVWDDYLDVTADADNFGKQVFADIVRGKKTLVIVRALEMLDPFDRRKLHDLIRKGDASEENVQEILTYLKRSGAIEWTHDRAKEFSSHARTCLTSLPENSARNLLQDICQYIVERQS